VYPEDGNGATTLLRSADTAMYQAKKSGLDSYRFAAAGHSRNAIGWRRGVSKRARRSGRRMAAASNQPKLEDLE
jgi:GGDEF domain-containing protein